MFQALGEPETRAMIGGKGNGMFPDKSLTGLSEGVLEALVLRAGEVRCGEWRFTNVLSEDLFRARIDGAEKEDRLPR